MVLSGIGAALLGPVRRLAGGWRTARRTAARVPDVVEAILILPRVSEQLELVGFQTATLLDMRDELARIGANTDALPPMALTLERTAALLDRVEANTAAVEQLAEIALPLQGAALRVGRLSDRWPARQRPGLPPTGPAAR